MLFLSGDSWPWYGCLATFFVILGAISLTLAFWPGFVHTWRTKNTEGLPIKLFSLFLLTGVLMTAGSICGIAKTPEWKYIYFKGCWFVYLNTFVMLVNLYTVGLWCVNQWKKKRFGSSSSDVRDLIEDEVNLLDEEGQEDTEFNIDENSKESFNEEELNLEGAI